jgi:hypothetical protein
MRILVQKCPLSHDITIDVQAKQTTEEKEDQNLPINLKMRLLVTDPNDSTDSG